HVFFDSAYLYKIVEKSCPETKLYAIGRGQLDSERIPPNMEILKMPLTSLLLYQILGGKADELTDSGASGGAFAIRLKDARLLVVDDIDINLMIASEVLGEYGGTVDTATSGAESIEMIKENDYDMVFMDHMMPGLDGVDVTKIVRALPGEKYKSLPIIALTANVVGDVRDLFIESGMNDFLAKPLDHAEIERVFREWLPKEKLEKSE
ncbi:MAG: response regulator, partial [Oscillospiraceae bacterium]|nr:response regulator [Oscillospiraceae bacterium]